MALAGYSRVEDLPGRFPVFPLDGAVLLPGGVLPLQIFEPRYLNMLDDVMAGEKVIGMIQTRGGDRASPGLAAVGCLGRVTRYSETPDGRYLIALTGVCRFSVRREVQTATPYRQVDADFEPYASDLTPLSVEPEGIRGPFFDLLKRYLTGRGIEVDWAAIDAAPISTLVDSLAMALPLVPIEKQALLEAVTADARREALCALMALDADLPGGSDDAPPALQ